MQIPDPNGMDLDQWVYGTLSVLTNYPNPRTMVNDDWRQWGMMFFDTPSLSTLGPPNPYDYAEWQPWAERLAESLGNAPGSPTPITPPSTNTTYYLTNDAGSQQLTNDSGLQILTSQ